jgi:hypothetical protein
MLVNISDKTIQELKALAYDEIVKLENAQLNLKTINAEIEKKNTDQED